MALGRAPLPSGAPVEAGLKLYLSQYVVHRHPHYFPDPERFDPGRLVLPVRRRAAALYRRAVALLKMLAVLSQVVPRFRLEVPDEPAKLRPTITLRSQGIVAVVRAHAV